MLVLFAALLPGCDADCQDTQRINGDFAVWHTVLNAGDGATFDENYPTYDIFVNGWSEWKITWQAGAGTMNVDIADRNERASLQTPPSLESFTGTLTTGDDNCNAFDMETSGDYTSAVGTVHSFSYTAHVVLAGDHYNGTFIYDDTYTGTDAEGNPISGGLSGAEGTVEGVHQSDGSFDTGF
jgi:hypothetical protein